MAARKLNPHTQRSHISSCKRFAAWLKVSVAPSPRCIFGQACDVHPAMSVEMDHMVSESMASGLGGRRFGGGTALCGMARV
jgi:hypothetical protein